MGIWNKQKPEHKIISIILVCSMVLSMLSGCGNTNSDVQKEEVTAETATEISEVSDADDADDMSIVSDDVNEAMHLSQEAVVEKADTEQIIMEALSDAVGSGNLEEAKQQLSELTESLAEGDMAIDEWIAAQDEAVEEITGNTDISEQAKELLSERAAKLKEELEENQKKAEIIISALERDIAEEKREEAKEEIENLKALLTIDTDGQTYGMESHQKAAASQEGTNLTSQSYDTDINDDVMELADELGTPLEIYNYLKNTIGFEYYYGSRKGANGTYAAFAGNDYDQASLFIGMLRYLGYEAEYVRGDILLDEGTALSLTGADNFEHAADVLAAAGIPVTKLRKDGKVVSIRMEHVWVRAHLPYSDYRGAGDADGDLVWLDLDTSIKAYEDVDNIYDAIDDVGIPEELIDAAGDKNIAMVSDILQSYIFDSETFSDENLYVRKRIIKREELTYLPAALPYMVENEVTTFSEIETSKENSVSFEVAGEDFGMYTLSELYGKTVILSYIPATNIDEEILNSYDSIFDVPASYVYLKPVLLIDGEVVRESDSSGNTLGETSDFTIYLNQVEGTENVKAVSNTISTGSIYAVTIDNQNITSAELRGLYGDVTDLKDSVTTHNVYSSSYLGNYLALVGKLYFAQVDIAYDTAAEDFEIIETRKLSEAITGYAVRPVGRYGIITRIDEGSLYIDVDTDSHSAVSLIGDKEAEKEFALLTGMMSSFYESQVWTQMTGEESISTITVLSYASQNNIDILMLNKDNITNELEKLNIDSYTKQDVINAVQKGNIVTIPCELVTIGGWTGTGYISADPETGFGSYIISGGINGGQVVVDATLNVITSYFFSITGFYYLTLAVSIALGPFGPTSPISLIGYTSIAGLLWILVELNVKMLQNYVLYLETGDMTYWDTMMEYQEDLLFLTCMEFVGVELVFSFMATSFYAFLTSKYGHYAGSMGTGILYDENGVYTGGRTQEELDMLAKDPAHAGSTRDVDIDKGIHEREVGLGLEERGDLVGPIIRDPSGAADFIDANGQAWDVKSFNSYYPVRNGGFQIDKSMEQIIKSINKGEYVILDTTDLIQEHLDQLLEEIEKQGLGGKVLIW